MHWFSHHGGWYHWESLLRQHLRDEHLQIKRKSPTHATTCSPSKSTKTNQALVPTSIPQEPPIGACGFFQGLGRMEEMMLHKEILGSLPYCQGAEARQRDCSGSEIPVGPVELVTCNLFLIPDSPRIKVIPRMRNLIRIPLGVLACGDQLSHALGGSQQ